jgi:hypothetical protein
MRAKPAIERSRWSRRPNFAPRQLLTAKQLNVGLEDGLERQRLLNRALHGYGVVFGYGLEVDDDGVIALNRGCIELTCGLALDHHGRMLYWQGGRIGMKDLVGKLPDGAGHYTLCLHYAERVPRADGCLPYSSDDTRWRDQGVAFTLKPHCDDADRSCPSHPDGSCITHDDFVCQRTGAVPASPGTLPPSDDLDWACAEPGSLCPTGHGDWGYDPAVYVPIACVKICDLTRHGDDSASGPEPPADEEFEPTSYRPTPSEPEGGSPGEYKLDPGGPTKHEPDRGDRSERHPREPKCDPKYGFCPSKPEVCKVRPHVYRTPLLYELLNCCDVDLPRVRSVSWSPWLERVWDAVPWPEFRQRMLARTDEPPEVGFAIWFTKPIEIATLHPGSIFLAAVYQEERTDYWMVQRVPFQRLDPLESDDDGEYASGVRLVPEGDWLDAEIRGRRSTLFHGAQFEVTVRGQLLRDKCGQMLDASPLDIDGHARCQGRPGGDFTTVFKVAPRDDGGNDDEMRQRPESKRETS